MESGYEAGGLHDPIGFAGKRGLLMKSHRTTIGITFLVCTILAMPALAGDANKAAQAFEEGKQLVAKASFDDAIRAFATAAKADPDNKAYRDEYALLRRIIKMRQTLAKERNEEKWETTAYALRSFYYENNLYEEALAVDKMFHERQNTPDTAARLAETLLELGRNSEAVDVLSAVDADHATLATRALLGIAYAREGRHGEAREIARSCEAPEGTGPGELMFLARLYTLEGDNADAMAALTRCFEGVPPSRLDAFKQRAKAHPDLTVLTRHVGFPNVLATASKIQESGCSGGASCATCPHRGKTCPSSTDKPAEKDE